jgi:hypothetical protein
MSKDPDNPRETSEQRAERMWRNNQLRQKYKEGKMPVAMMVNPEDIDHVNFKVRVNKDPPPEVGTVVINKGKRKPVSFERKFLKEIRAMLDERKQEYIEMMRASLAHERRKLMLEKLRRMELRIAESEKKIAEKKIAEKKVAQPQNTTNSKDLFA